MGTITEKVESRFTRKNSAKCKNSKY